MSPVVHGLIGWLLAWAVLDRTNDRRLAVIAALAPDIDGVFVLFSNPLFLAYHHTFGHTLAFGVPVALTAAMLGERRLRTGLAALGAFSLHLAADVVGTGWAIHPLYPLASPSLSIGDLVGPNVIYGVIDPATFVAVLGLVAVVMYRGERSPFELLSERLDRRLVALYVYPIKHRCSLCGKRAHGRCPRCGRAVCTNHMATFWRSVCTSCAEGSVVTP